jgi:hypothetical protein
VSKAEWENIQKTGEIRSKGEENFGDVQKGMTYFSRDPGQAQQYSAALFEPKHKPTPDEPNYLLAVRVPPEDRVHPEAAGGPDEVAVSGATPASDIAAAYEVRPYALGDEGVQHDAYHRVDKPTDQGPNLDRNVWDLTPEEFRDLDWDAMGGGYSDTPRAVFSTPPGGVVTVQDYARSEVWTEVRGDEYDDGKDPAWKATLDREKVKRDEPIVVYRAIEAERTTDVILPGDYVTENPDYAKAHGEAQLAGHYRLVSMQVKPSELAAPGDPHEFQWWPQDPKAALDRVREQARNLGLTDDDSGVEKEIEVAVDQEKSLGIQPPNGPVKTEKETYAAVPGLLDGYRSVLNMGKGVSARLDADVVTPEAGGLTAAIQKMDPDKINIVLAPPKGQERARQKVDTKYGGDWSRLNDIVRGTIVLPKIDDLGRTVQAVREEADKRGWKVSAIENRMVAIPGQANSPGPTPSGYRDFTLKLQSPEGFQTELQISTIPMVQAKQGGGHKLYEEERSILAEAASANRGLTADEQAHIDDLRRKQADLYREAWRASIHST